MVEFDPVYNRGGDSVTCLLSEEEAMIYDEIQVGNVSCVPFAKPSSKRFFSRWKVFLRFIDDGRSHVALLSVAKVGISETTAFL